jgi:lipid-A-disaccharide synthase
MQIAIITGEASGDRVGGQLAQEIRRLHPSATIWGTGGKFLRDAGAEVVIDSTRWGVVGVAAAIGLLPRILAARRQLHSILLQRRPDVLIPVDAGAFNIGFPGIEGLCPWTRRRLPETRILYYFPPGSWRRTLKGSSLGALADKVATPFPWSETELRRFGVDATFVGHPLLDLVHPSGPLKTFAEKHGIDPERPIVGILPGSRSQEITHILPAQLAAARIIHQRVHGVQFVLALAPTVDREEVIAHVEKVRRTEAPNPALRCHEDEGTNRPGAVPIPVGGNGVPKTDDFGRRQADWLRRAAELPPPSGDFPLAIIEEATYDLMGLSDVLICASGTATLEAAILGRPMVIMYRLAQSNWLEYQFVKKKLPRFIGMPNILAEREICPELIQEKATPENIADAIVGLLLEPDTLQRMRVDLRATVKLLGELGGATRTAQMAIELAQSRRDGTSFSKTG